MATLTCFTAWALALVLFPLLFILWLSETPQQRARRWRSYGQTYRSIAERLHVSPSTARRYCLA